MIFIYVMTDPDADWEQVCRLSDVYMQLARDVGVYGAAWGLSLSGSVAYDSSHRFIASGRVVGILTTGIDRLVGILTRNDTTPHANELMTRMLLTTCETYLASVISKPDSYLFAVDGIDLVI